MKTLLLINPAAGGGRGEKIQRKVVRLLQNNDLHVDLQLTQYPGHASQLAKDAIDAGYKIQVNPVF